MSGTSKSMSKIEPPNGFELSCPAEAGCLPPILAHASGPGALPHGPARRVSFSELLCAIEVLLGLGHFAIPDVDAEPAVFPKPKSLVHTLPHLRCSENTNSIP